MLPPGAGVTPGSHHKPQLPGAHLPGAVHPAWGGGQQSAYNISNPRSKGKEPILRREEHRPDKWTRKESASESSRGCWQGLNLPRSRGSDPFLCGFLP